MDRTQETEQQLYKQLARLQRVESGELGSMRLCDLVTRDTVIAVYWDAAETTTFGEEVTLLNTTAISAGLYDPSKVYFELTAGSLATARIGLIEQELAKRALYKQLSNPQNELQL